MVLLLTLRKDLPLDRHKPDLEVRISCIPGDPSHTESYLVGKRRKQPEPASEQAGHRTASASHRALLLKLMAAIRLPYFLPLLKNMCL